MVSFDCFVLLFAILFLSWGVQAHTDTPLSMRARYQRWMIEHNKNYANSAEKEERFQIFQENVRYIDAHNADGNKSYTLGLNKFADLTNEEYLERATGYRPPRVWNTSASYKHSSESNQLPIYWDWRRKGAVSPVKDQTCGNCWLFTGVAEVESMNFIATGKMNILSEQEIMDCDDLPEKGGCNGGWPQEVYEYVKHYSLTLEADYPNQPSAQTCDQSKKSRDRYAHVSGYVNMPSYLSDDELKQAVMRQPVSVTIDASSPAFKAYTGGVFTGPCDNNLNHVLSIVGFSITDGLKHWIARNSWGTRWGDGGYILIQMGTGRREGLCGINMGPSYPVY